MDQDLSRDPIHKFTSQIKKILQTIQIEDPMTDITQTLARTDTLVNFLCEARNILAKQDQKKTTAMR